MHILNISNGTYVFKVQLYIEISMFNGFSEFPTKKNRSQLRLDNECYGFLLCSTWFVDPAGTEQKTLGISGARVPRLVYVRFLATHCSKSWSSSPAIGRQQTLCIEIRLVIKHRMISISKTCFSLKIDILIHNWTSKQICSIRYTQYLYFLFWKSRK